MTLLDRVPKLRWIVPATAAAVIVGGGAILSSAAPADAAQQLPPRSAAQLLVDVQQASLTGLSGTVVQSSDLGLPALPGLGGAGSSNLTSLATGTHTLRLWYAGPQQMRVALLGSLGESDVIRNGKDLWTWSSQDNTATHRTLSGAANGAKPSLPELPASPQQAATMAIGAISPSTTVTTDGSAEVAGRPAYELVLAPKQQGSLVSSVRVAIDATEHIPLRVQVFATGQADPAIQVAFSAVDFARPDAAQFAFNPPPGAKVVQQGAAKPSDQKQTAQQKAAEKSVQQAAGHSKVVGTGWTSVVVADAFSAMGALGGLGADPAGPGASPDAKAGQPKGPDLGAMIGILGALPKVSGSWGSGHLFSSKLLSAVITDDGRVAIGAVTPTVLYAALGSK